MKNIFSKNTRAAISMIIALLLTYHITRPFWIYSNYNCFIDMSIKFCIDLTVLLMAWKSAKQNRKKRNQCLLLVLFFYYIGDMITSFTPVPAAVPYAAGHILLLYCINNTCIIKKWQYLLTGMLVIASIPVIILVRHMLPALTVPLCLTAFLYGVLLIAKFCLSLTNRFFRCAAVLFLIGDTFGFLRITILTRLTPVIDYTAYVAAITLYGLSACNCSRKDVVCFGDITALNRILAKKRIQYFICGEWSKNLFLHRFVRQTAQIEIIYSADQYELLQGALDSLHYHAESCSSGKNKLLYSEKSGYLKIKAITLLPDNSIIYHDKNNNEYILDPGFIHTLKWGKTVYPCIFPIDENDQVLEFLMEE